jgi:hypothetical protein
VEAQVKKRKTIALVGVGVAGVALALSGANAFAGQEDAATGGGQILVGDKGAGDTVAFTAQGTADAARGQVQYVDREGGTGQGQTVMHGTVTCIDVQGNVARIAGEWRDGGTFGLYVQDNGEGDGSDMIAVTPNLTDCAEDRDDNDPTGLARGNAQVRDRG